MPDPTRDTWATRGRVQTMATLGLIGPEHAQAMRTVLDLVELKLVGDDDTAILRMDGATGRAGAFTLAAAITLLAEEMHLVGQLTEQAPKRVLRALHAEMRRRFAAVGIRWPGAGRG